MINIQKIDENNQFTPEGERQLLEKDPEEVRSFYALTGPARLEYAKQMAEAEAQRIRTLRKAQAEGIVEIRKAEAEGLRLISDALTSSSHPELVARLAELLAVEDVAQSLANGNATKLFLPQDPTNLFGLIAALSEISRKDEANQTDSIDSSVEENDASEAADGGKSTKDEPK